MCGIIGAVSTNSVTDILLNGLSRLEYRGYDSAGIAVINATAEQILRERVQGKVSALRTRLETSPLSGSLGIAHTRWATHGVPSEANAHPHISNRSIALVHNGIIENHDVLRRELVAAGYQLSSETDSELIAHLIDAEQKKGASIKEAIFRATRLLKGAYALGIITKQDNTLYAVRRGSPLIIGLSDSGHFIASDPLALHDITNRFVYLEEGDFAQLNLDGVKIYDADYQETKRAERTINIDYSKVDKGDFDHFMLKEIHEQPEVVAATLEGRLGDERILPGIFGAKAEELFAEVEHLQIIACGTSYHAAMVAGYWFEEYLGLPCRVEIASEFRYRKAVVQNNTLFIAISQSGETADTLAALRQAKSLGFLASLAICNVPESALVREADLILMTRAGIEVGVASTKAFTTQLTALLLLVANLSRYQKVTKDFEKNLVNQLRELPAQLEQALTLEAGVKKLAERFADKQNALFLGRGAHYPVALEGALKLKEISYIHAEAYAAGELKHGPLALVDKSMPVVAVAPNDELIEKLKSNLEEVRSRGGELLVFADKVAQLNGDGGTITIMQAVDRAISPIIYTVPLQLLAYYVAVLKGTDIDQPRNLAKSVTVE